MNLLGLYLLLTQVLSSNLHFICYRFCVTSCRSPPWNPIPIITVVAPDIPTLCEQANIICRARVPSINRPPYDYIIQDDKLIPLWHSRRQAWDHILKTLDTPDSSHLVQFLHDVSVEFVKVVNIVLAYNPKSHPKDLRCAIDDALWKKERAYVPRRFVTFWNEGCSDTITTILRSEWEWVLPNLVIACRRSLASSIRVQLDEDSEDRDKDIKDYVGDSVCTTIYLFIFITALFTY